MKYPGAGTSTTLFCEQVSTVTSLFEQWNDCEKSVVLYALLKRVPFANLKFLQFSVEYNLTQNYNTQSKFYALEQNANNAIFLTKLLQKYKSLKKTGDVRLLGGNGQTTNTTYLDGGGKQEKKEDILNDILTYLLLLKPGNDDAKAVYMSIIPCAIDDSTRNLVPTELVQQILSYLLIHPALTNEDRRSLSQWLRHLEDHISLSYVPQTVKTKSVAFQSDLTTASTSPYLTSTSSLSSTSWQTVAPPPTLAPAGTQQPSIVKSTAAATSSSKDSLWDLHSIQMTQDFCDEIKEKEFMTQPGSGGGGGTGGSYLNKSASQSSQSTGPTTVPQTALQAATATSSGSATSPSSSSVQLFDTSEDHHISFSKNGTEVIDFDCDDYNNSKSNTQIAFDSTQLSDFLTVPNYLMLENNMMTKTRRSNSLTTTPVTATTTTSLGSGQQQHQQQQTHQLLGGDCYSSSSAENLANLTAAQQKPRSFSLSMASPRSSLTSSGSETRLDEFCNSNINTIKQNHMKNGGMNGANIGLTSGSSNNIGMSGIGQWLKSLRLHKYIWLFSNLTYDQMLDINEEYLQSLGVTKGARHKLVICIQKLRERCQCLQQMEKELLSKQKPLNSVLEEMTNIVLTPMRPFDRYKKDDVAGQFMQMIDCVSMTIMKNPICTPTDEECINMFLWILEKALHNDAFLAQTNQLKEHKYKVSKIKMQFTPKSHYTKNPNVNGNISKSRWTSNTKHKPDGQLMNNNNNINNNNNNSTNNNNLIKIHRKNSNVMPPPHFPTAMLHMQQQQQQQQKPQSQSYGQPQSNQPNSYNNKSSSYPNFICSTNSSSNMMMNSFKQHQPQQTNAGHPQPPQHQQQQQQQQHQPPQQQQGTHYANGTPYHRHSLNNLITINTNNPSFLNALSNPPPSLQAAVTTAAPPPPLNNRENNKNNLNMDILAELSNVAANNGGGGGAVVNGMAAEQQRSVGGGSSKPSIGDINSRLEFLCLQMTEQAIN